MKDISGINLSFRPVAQVLITLLLIGCTTSLLAQTTQDLRVLATDAFNSVPLSGALVVLSQDGQTIETRTTGADGSAVFTVTVTSAETLPGTKFLLAAPYPSPSLGRSTIPVDLDKSGNLSVNLFDTLGRKVASQSAVLPSGGHTIGLDLSGLARGTYFASVELDGEARMVRPIVLTSTSGGSPAIFFTASSVAIPKTSFSKTGRGPNNFELRVTRDGYVDGNYFVDVSKSQNFTAWMNIRPETVAVNGFVVAETGNDAVPLVGAYEDGTTFHIFGNMNAPLPSRVIVTSPAGEHMSITLRSDGLPERVVAGSTIALFGNYRDGLVDIAIILPDGSSEFALGVDISQVLSLGKGSSTRSVLAWGLSDTLGAIGFATSVASCGLSIAGAFITSGAAAPFAFISCGALALQAASLLLPTDSPALEASAAGLGAFGATLGCIDPVKALTNLSWIDCVAAVTLWAEAISISSDDTESSQQEAVNDAKTTLGIPLFEATTNSIGMELIRIPAGTFQMGSNNGSSDERPVHSVTLTTAFWIGKYEVTRGEYRMITGTSTSDENLPVSSKSWIEAISFANALSTKEGFSSCYNSNGNVNGGDIYACTGYRLPTEAEWEFMARAGTITEYSFGSDASQLNIYAWYIDNSGAQPHPVGEKQPNPWGLYDVHGNVWEWTHDRYFSGYYSVSPTANPPGPSSGSDRTGRGGYWLNQSGHTRSARRFGAQSSLRGTGFGFRLARTAR